MYLYTKSDFAIYIAFVEEIFLLSGLIRKCSQNHVEEIPAKPEIPKIKINLCSHFFHQENTFVQIYQINISAASHHTTNCSNLFETPIF